MLLSAVILAKTDSEELFRMTSVCIASLLESESAIVPEIIVVESNKNYTESSFKYPDFVKVIIPEVTFNFHKYLNIGIAAASSDFIALCNNDLIFHKNWFSEILKVSEKYPNILSFSPNGMRCAENETRQAIFGHRVMQQIMGWCIVVKKEIFKTIGPLDEKFDFYYADNDYSMTLRYYNLKHAMVCKSYVQHLERKSVPKISNVPAAEKAFISKYEVPRYLSRPHYSWVFDSERYLSGILKYHNKWGTPDLLYRKNKIADLLFTYNLGWLNRFFLKIKF